MVREHHTRLLFDTLMEIPGHLKRLRLIVFLISLSVILYELLLTKIFNVILFGPQAHLAIALALLGSGIGAMLLYVRPKLFNINEEPENLKLFCIYFSLAILFCLLYVTQIQLTFQSVDPPETFQERGDPRYKVLNTFACIAMIPILVIPFAVAGIIVAGIFRDAPVWSGVLYAYDLLGAALGSLLFVCVIYLLPATTALCVVVLFGIACAYLSTAPKNGGNVSRTLNVSIVLCIGIIGYSLISGKELLPIRFAAGFSESTIHYSKWTPLTRISVFRSPKTGSESIVLDNGSASKAILNYKEQQIIAETPVRGLVYTLPGKKTRAAIIGASAGPEVAAADYYKFHKILAIDVAGDIFSLMKKRYADTQYNPYLRPNVETRSGDGRAVIFHEQTPFDVIQIVHANLWSLSGTLSNVWSPSLLETKEAFKLYLDKLAADGTLEVARGVNTYRLLPAIREAFHERGVSRDEFWRHVAFVRMDAIFLLIKNRPWTQNDLDALLAWEKKISKPLQMMINPLHGMDQYSRHVLATVPVMTDDKPFSDVPEWWDVFYKWAFKNDTSHTKMEFVDAPLAYTYSVFVVQVVIVVGLGALFLLGPILFRVVRIRQPVSAIINQLSYSSMLGFGFIGVELGLMSALILFVPQPTYVMSATICSMLLFAGIGSHVSLRIPLERAKKTLSILLLLIVVLGILLFWVCIPQAIHSMSGTPLLLRTFVLMVLVAPLAFLLGFPMPVGIRLLSSGTTLPIAPWMWALNCWASVAGSFIAVLISRFYGNSYGFAVSLICYILAFFILRMMYIPSHVVVKNGA